MVVMPAISPPVGKVTEVYVVMAGLVLGSVFITLLIIYHLQLLYNALAEKFGFADVTCQYSIASQRTLSKQRQTQLIPNATDCNATQRYCSAARAVNG